MTQTAVNALTFLNCLYGSEQQIITDYVATEFLNCLYGSEHRFDKLTHEANFLNCLYGSELERSIL